MVELALETRGLAPDGAPLTDELTDLPVSHISGPVPSDPPAASHLKDLKSSVEGPLRVHHFDATYGFWGVDSKP